MLGTRYWQEHPADLLCFGAGGAATAISLSLLASNSTDGKLRPADSTPRRAIFTDVRPERLQALGATLARLGSLRAELELVLVRDRSDADDLLPTMPSGSLVVNATGLGKDAPGSPISDAAIFPAGSVVWELNYRGERLFLAQASRQQQERQMRVHDGWLYFLCGWFQALAPILGFIPEPACFERFRRVSDAP
jgi:shikimate dehydrogenase